MRLALLTALHVSQLAAFSPGPCWVQAASSEMAKPTAQISLLGMLLLPESSLLMHVSPQMSIRRLAQCHPAPACHSVRLTMQGVFLRGSYLALLACATPANAGRLLASAAACNLLALQAGDLHQCTLHHVGSRSLVPSQHAAALACRHLPRQPA